MKAIIPAAGLGTRFLPATKAQPKEMLPVVDKPVIQYVVEEAWMAGMESVLIVTSRGKRAIENHFDGRIDKHLHEVKGPDGEMLRALQELCDSVEIFFVRQKYPHGLGDAILSAERFVKDEPFAVLLGDVIVHSQAPCIGQLAEFFSRYNANIVGVERVPKEKVHLYGIIPSFMVKEAGCPLYGPIANATGETGLNTTWYSSVGGGYQLTRTHYLYLTFPPGLQKNVIYTGVKIWINAYNN